MCKYGLIAILLLSLFTASCGTMTQHARYEVPEPGSIVARRSEPREAPSQSVYETQEAPRIDPRAIQRQMDQQNRRFNERVRSTMAVSSQRGTPPVAMPPVEVPAGDAQPLSINFYDADLLEVIRLFMSLLEMNFVIHPQVSGRVTLSVSDSFRPDQIFDLLEGILRINGMAMIQKEETWEILPLAQVPKHISRGWFQPFEEGRLPRRGQMIQAFRLRFISATEMTNIIKPYLSETAQIYAHESSGVMLVCDYPHALTRATQLISVFDESVFAGVHTATYALKYVTAEDAVKELNEVAKTFGLGADGIGVRGRVSFLALARLNVLLALARDPQVLDFIDLWVRELDRELPEYIQEQYGEGIYVYDVQYGNADEIVTTLQGLFEYKEPEKDEKTTLPLSARVPEESRDKAAEPPTLIREQPFPTPTGDRPSAASGKLTGPVVFVVDEAVNAVLIRCNSVDYPKILSVIERLDQYPRQVLIEVIIAEVNLTDDTKLGVEWRLASSPEGLFQDFGLQTGIGGVFPVEKALIGTGLSYVIKSSERFQAALKASAEAGHVRILSTPTLLASDNKPALINIGDEIPIPTSRIVRDDDVSLDRRSTETSISYRDTGIILKVLPKINRMGMVRMEISQEVSSLTDKVVEGVNAPIISTRHTSTTVAVNDQQTIVIGGLMSRRQSDGSSGVPGLIRVPILKYLFGYQRQQFENSELMIFITPHVVAGEDDSSFITHNFLQRLNTIKAGMY